MPLHRAAESGDVDAVKQVIGAHIEVDSQAVKVCLCLIL